MTKEPRRSSSVPPSRGSVTENQNETIAFLSDADSYGLRANVQVKRCATHASVVFLAGDFAYKLKRAVRYPYLDYSTVERRRAMCEAELAVNRRLAPSLYLEVRPVARDTNARLHFGSSDESAIDWVLVMRRFCASGSARKCPASKKTGPANHSRTGGLSCRISRPCRTKA